MSFPAFEEIGTDPMFVEQPTTTVVYVHLKARLDFNEFRIQKVASIARRLGIHPDTAAAALRALCERGYLVRKPFDGRTQTYRLVFARPSETPPKPDHSLG